MDGKLQDESKAYIWLRYSTSYTRDGKQHTLEMNVPVPIGATDEVREQLFREAEAGMHQLAGHVEQRGQNGQRVVPVGQQARPSVQQPAPRPSTPRPASTPAPQTGPQPSTVRESEAVLQNTDTTTLRNQVGASMPRTLAPSHDMGTGNMPLTQFIQYIKENMDLSPRQAMELLNVRSLGTGINLREALEQLKQIKQTGSQQSNPVVNTTPSLPKAPVVQPSAPEVGKADAVVEQRPQAPAGFDEEIEAGELDELDDLSAGPATATSRLTPKQIARAREKISQLRESQGASTASSSRLQVLNNVVVSQISEDELMELISGVWNVTTLKKLKLDQVEALISWAKHDDDFSELVDHILSVLEEESYARSNR